MARLRQTLIPGFDADTPPSGISDQTVLQRLYDLVNEYDNRKRGTNDGS